MLSNHHSVGTDLITRLSFMLHLAETDFDFVNSADSKNLMH